MRIAYFSCQMPYPATHGGLVDDWARLNAMKDAGAKLALITWYAGAAGPLPQAHVAALRGVAEVVHTVPVRSALIDRVARLVRLMRWPSHMASRVPTRAEQRAIWQSLDAFKPEAIWLDAVYPSVMARQAAKRYKVPMFYRSHNIEHRYMRSQIERATSWRDRMAWSMNMPHLKRVEFEAWRCAHTVFDISMDDLQWWHQQGLSNARWLPPLVHPDKVRSLSAPYDKTPCFDVGYLGNLRTPNNVEGVLWFLNEVWPLVLRERSDCSFLLAGSAPSPLIREAVSRAPGVTLLENPPDVVPVLRDARVLVNPVFAGSGVNVKSVEMLFTPARLVASPQGVAGLPPFVQDCFDVTSETDGFARAVLSALQPISDHAEQAVSTARRLARAEFEYTRMLGVLGDMQAAIGG